LATVIVDSERIRAKRILEILKQNVSVHDEDFATLVVARETSDPFRVLVVTIFSQSCTDIAALRAYRTLDRQVGVTPQSLSRTKTQDIAKAIRVAGLYKQKSRALKKLAQISLKHHSRTLDGILRYPVDQARFLLQELPNVGPKTADVLLSVWGRSTISVDTQVNRVSKRLGLAPQKAKYEEVRTALMHLYKPEDYHSIPLLFMAHGRKTCRSPRPRCSSCPDERLCPFIQKNLEHMSQRVAHASPRHVNQSIKRNS